MPVKLIALDMDGTLLTSECEVTQKNAQALQKAVDKGIEIAIASGRCYNSLPQNVLKLGNIRYAITSNGNIVDLKEKRSIHKFPLNPQSIKEVLNYVDAEKMVIEVFFNGQAYAEKKYFNMLEEFHIPKAYYDFVLNTRTPSDNIYRLIDDNIDIIENINFQFIDMGLRKDIYKQLKQNKNICVSSSSVSNLEIGSNKASKAGGLKFLCNYLDITTAELMACGDNDNDISMLEIAGYSVAMGNANDNVKSIAKFVTKTNNEDGVAYAIEKYCGL